ncbi:MAG: peptidylprolyl cis-trans isomerase lipoprotein, PpiC-type [Deltaproteobacteria bacterium]|nr:peptidylprolyl cis-trans isomerase lipoprotein, PpiC-type [Deltaproteobacteria bacterium]
MTSRRTPRHDRRRLKTNRSAAAGTALIAVLAALMCSCSGEPPPRSDAEIVVAEVDNVPLLLRDVKSEVLAARSYSPSLEDRGADRAEVSEAIRRLVERTIVLREGSRRGVEVSFASLEEEVARYRSDFPEGGLEKALVQMGMSADEWRERLRSSILYRKSADAIASSLVSVTPLEVAEAYRREGKPGDRPERIRVRQFLFESVALAEAARGRLLGKRTPGGEGGFAAEGVDLGFFSRKELPPELPRELFRMKEGELSEPVLLEDSVSLFRIEERELARPQSLETEEKRIRESLLAARREEAFRRWLSDACVKADVKIRADLLEKLVAGRK